MSAFIVWDAKAGPRVNALGGTSVGTGVLLALKRKLWSSDNSLVLVSPSQVAEMCGFEVGQVVEGRLSPKEAAATVGRLGR